jgi:PAS domain S-box-containing protein
VERTERSKTELVLLRNYFWMLLILWTVLVGSILLWSLLRQKHDTEQVARIQARDSFEKDITYRRWAAEHGGVYVPITDKTPPNSYLSHIEERDVTTRSGQSLTLVNPAYMTRQVYELELEHYGSRGHITSLNPIRPENAADDWEAEALRALKQGVKEVSSVEMIDNQQYMRLMRPMMTEQSCLKCHAEQGYKAGDLRGGISVSIPMAPIQAIARGQILTLAVGHFVLWLLGVSGVSFGGRRLKQHAQERKQTYELLRISEASYHAIFESANDAIFIHDVETGKILNVNQKACELFGYTREELKQLSVGDVSTGIPPYDQEHAFERIVKGVKTGQQLFEWTCKTKSGETFWVEVNLKLAAIEEHDCVLAVVRDITERKNAEKELRRQQYYLAKAQDMGRLGTWDLDVPQNKLVWTDENYRVFGVPLGTELTYELFLDCVHPDDRKYVDEQWEKALNNEPYDIEHRLLVDGQVKWVREKAEAVFDEKGNCVRGIGFTQDITERKQAEQELENLAKFPSENPNPVMRITKEGVLLYANLASASFLTEWGIAVGGMVPVNWQQSVSEVFAAGSSKRVEVQHADRIFAFMVVPIHDAGYANLYARDITDAKLAENQLKEARDQLEARVQERTKELARTVEVLQGEVVERMRLQREVLEISEEEQRRIGRELHDGLQQELVGMTFECQLLNKILAAKSLPEADDAARIHRYLGDAIDHTRAITRMLYPIDLDSKDISFALKQLASRVESLFHISCQFTGPKSFVVERPEVAINIYRIVQEAVTNAVKHGKADCVSVDLKSRGNRITFAIKDNGIGLTADYDETKGMGLRIMKYRSSVIGATLTIKPNAEGPGVVVVCTSENKDNNLL